LGEHSGNGLADTPTGSSDKRDAIVKGHEISTANCAEMREPIFPPARKKARISFARRETSA
jgi:hypothetical protein